MFGIIRPCRHRLGEGLTTAWWAHLCGLCLALRDAHGQLARVATTYDGVVVSALVEAQSADGPQRRSAGPCPLRGMRPASVAVGDAARLAASASLVLASAKVRDHVDDGDGVFARRPVAAGARVVASRWARQGARTGAVVGLDTAVLHEAVERQAEVERSAVRGGVLSVTEPTEAATAAVFAHTAMLAGRPGNVEPLREAGRLFGRIVHLLDAVEDLRDDRRTGAWNPLDATGTSLERARALCDDAVLGVGFALRDCDLPHGALARALLTGELRHAVARVFREAVAGRTASSSASSDDGAQGSRGGAEGPLAVMALVGGAFAVCGSLLVACTDGCGGRCCGGCGCAPGFGGGGDAPVASPTASGEPTSTSTGSGHGSGGPRDESGGSTVGPAPESGGGTAGESRSGGCDLWGDGCSCGNVCDSCCTTCCSSCCGSCDCGSCCSSCDCGSSSGNCAC